MKLIGNLKKKVENAKTKEEARDTIKKAGMLLDDDELEKVSGGAYSVTNNLLIHRNICHCNNRIEGPTGIDASGYSYVKCGNCDGYIKYAKSSA